MTVSRKAKGTPSGGQFAGRKREEASLDTKASLGTAAQRLEERAARAEAARTEEERARRAEREEFFRWAESDPDEVADELMKLTLMKRRLQEEIEETQYSVDNPLVPQYGDMTSEYADVTNIKNDDYLTALKRIAKDD